MKIKEKKTEIICIRLTKEERDLMEESCEKLDTTPSRLLRRLLSLEIAKSYDIRVPRL